MNQYYPTSQDFIESLKPFLYPVVYGPLVAGGLCYLFFRNESILINYILINTPVKPLVGVFSNLVLSWPLEIQFLFFSLPNAMWSFSASAYFATLWSWRKDPTFQYTMAIVCFSIIIELLQTTMLVPGTFDIFDIIALLLVFPATIFAYSIQKRRVR